MLRNGVTLLHRSVARHGASGVVEYVARWGAFVDIGPLWVGRCQQSPKPRPQPHHALRCSTSGGSDCKFKRHINVLTNSRCIILATVASK
eukprot:5217210-Amphidinium_carterae.1